jgi:hypothetical protein
LEPEPLLGPLKDDISQARLRLGPLGLFPKKPAFVIADVEGDYTVSNAATTSSGSRNSRHGPPSVGPSSCLMQPAATSKLLMTMVVAEAPLLPGSASVALPFTVDLTDISRSPQSVGPAGDLEAGPDHLEARYRRSSSFR